MQPRTRYRLVFSLATLAIGTVWACYFGTLESVHFFAPESEEKVDFGRLPQQIMETGWNNLPRRAGTDDAKDFAPDGDPTIVTPATRVETFWQRADSQSDSDDKKPAKKEFKLPAGHARNLETQGHLREAVEAYGEAVDMDSESFLRGRREVLIASGGKNSPALQEYLRATYLSFALDQDPTAALRGLLQKPVPPYLRKILLDRLPDPAILPEFSQAKALLQEDGDAINATKGDAVYAGHLLRSILQRHPRTSQKGAVYGWLARSEFLLGHFDQAIAYYDTQLGLDPSRPQRWTAHQSQYIVYGAKGRHDRQVETMLGEWFNNPDSSRHTTAGMLLRKAFDSLTAAEARSLQSRLRHDPNLLAAYLGFRIEQTKLTDSQERGLFRFAQSALRHLPNAKPILVLRTGQASYNAGLYSATLELADRVLSGSKVPKDIRQRAEYLRAGALVRLGRPDPAIREYEKLLGSDPRNYLARSAKEHLALLQDRYGDPLAAMKLYREMHYDWDYAYLADAKMTPEQLASAVRSTPKGEARNILLYTLGMRYLRLERYEDAKGVWRQIGTTDRLHFGLSPIHFQDFHTEFVSGGSFDAYPDLPDPLVTTKKLARWSRASRRGSSESRARALYLMASYVYDHKNLLFYSPALWKFDRVWAFSGENWNPDVNDRADTAARKRHMVEHECYSQALKFCKRIVENYPDSSVAPQALYTGGVSAEHLTNLNEFWRGNDTDKYLGLATRYLRLLAKRYPNHPLAKKAGKYANVFNEERQQRHWSG